MGIQKKIDLLESKIEAQRRSPTGVLREIPDVQPSCLRLTVLPGLDQQQQHELPAQLQLPGEHCVVYVCTNHDLLISAQPARTRPPTTRSPGPLSSLPPSAVYCPVEANAEESQTVGIRRLC